MFFTLSKIFSVFLQPITWIILLLVISFFLRKKSLRIIFKLLAVLLLLVFTNSYLTRVALRSWEMPLSSQSEITSAFEVGIVLGGGQVQFDEQSNELVFIGNTDRFLKAVELYKSKKIRNILISGGNGSFYRYNVPEAELLKDYLSGNGIVPSYNIWIDTLSRNTHENAVECKKILTVERVRQPSLLITSGAHMPRSLACFEDEGVPVVPFVSSQYYLGNRTDFEFYVLPKVDNLFIWNSLFHEWFGWFFYRISGYI
jgi:uncharacterized SAM-binding protein YcdF (DUF218 family)